MGAAAGKPGRALIAAAVAALLLLAAAPGDASRVPRGLRRPAPRGARLPEAEGGEAGGPLRGGAQTYGGSSSPASAASTFPHRLLKARAEAQLDQIADWVMTLGLRCVWRHPRPRMDGCSPSLPGFLSDPRLRRP